MTARLASVATHAPVNGAVCLVLFVLLVGVYLAMKNSKRARSATDRPTIRETRAQVLHPERLCMVKTCGNEYTASINGWRVCDTHDARKVVAS